jgi:hypothetical protein
VIKVMLAFAIAVLAVPATTFADDTDQAAKQSFERGRQLAGEAKWAQAFDAFSSGYDASHRSVFLFNMAECARALDDAPRARGLYQQYLAASPSGDLADTARARLAAMPGATTATTPPPAHPTVTTTTTPPPAPAHPTTTTPPAAPAHPATTPAPAPAHPTTTVATRPIVIPPLPPPSHAPPATTLTTPPTHVATAPAPTTTTAIRTTAPAPTTTTAIRTTAPAPTTAASTTVPAPNLTVAQLPPTSPTEHPIGASAIGDAHPSEPIWRRKSFWVGVGLAVAAGTVAVIAASGHDNNCSTPGCIDLRR